jgi:hypothetical protein
MVPLAFFYLLLSPPVLALNFPWELDQLTDHESISNPAYRFGPSNTSSPKQCKTIPGDPDWPTDAAWSAFNATLGGVLLKPQPLGSVCYYGPSYSPQLCASLQQNWASAALQFVVSPLSPPKLN